MIYLCRFQRNTSSFLYLKHLCVYMIYSILVFCKKIKPHLFPLCKCVSKYIELLSINKWQDHMENVTVNFSSECFWKWTSLSFCKITIFCYTTKNGVVWKSFVKTFAHFIPSFSFLSAVLYSSPTNQKHVLKKQKNYWGSFWKLLLFTIVANICLLEEVIQ